MKRVRVIPVLTLDKEKLVKTIKFKKPTYIGDPINAVKIFNTKEVDEMILLDITASKQNRIPNFQLIEEICSEAFMPFAYGGGIKKLEDIKKLFQLGIEKIVLNTCVEENFQLIKEASSIYGSQSIIVSLDLKKNIFGKYQLMKKSGSKKVKFHLKDYIKKLEDFGTGEIFINLIDKEGTSTGYDFDIIQSISNMTTLPVVACGGAKNMNSFKQAIHSGASAVAAGSLFIYSGNTKGILINYPSQEKLYKSLFSKL